MVMLLGVSWLMLMPGPHLFYEGEDDDPAFTLTGTGYLRGTLSMLPARARHSDPQGRDIVFSTITSITLWCIWKSRCVEVLGSVSPSIVYTLREIWLEIMHTSGRLFREWGEKKRCIPQIVVAFWIFL